MRSLSPTHLERQSAPLRMKKETLRPALEHSLANARAHSVLPVPGGPWKSTPRGGSILKRWKNCRVGRVNVSVCEGERERKENARCWRQGTLLANLGVHERKDNHFLERLDVVTEAANVVKVDFPWESKHNRHEVSR